MSDGVQPLVIHQDYSTASTKFIKRLTFSKRSGGILCLNVQVSQSSRTNGIGAPKVDTTFVTLDATDATKVKAWFGVE